MWGGESENLIWAKSDLKLDFRFTELLDCKHFHRDTNIQARLAEQVFVQNNLLWTGLGYTPHQLVLGLSSGVPGIYDVPENDNTNLSRPLERIRAGINKRQVTQPHSTLGDSFPYEPGYSVHFLGPKGRIGLGCISDISGGEHRIVHSGTRSKILFGDYMSPTTKTWRAHSLSAALSPILTTIKWRSEMRVSFKLGTQIHRSKRSGR